MLPMRLGWLSLKRTFLLNIRYSLLCCICVLASTFSQLRCKTRRNTWRLISFSRFTSESSQFIPKSQIMWNRVLDSFRDPANLFSLSLWCSVGNTGKSRQKTFMMNLGIFVAFLFFFSGFSIRSGRTRSNGLMSCLGSKTIFLVGRSLGEGLSSEILQSETSGLLIFFWGVSSTGSMFLHSSITIFIKVHNISTFIIIQSSSSPYHPLVFVLNQKVFFENPFSVRLQFSVPICRIKGNMGDDGDRCDKALLRRFGMRIMKGYSFIIIHNKSMNSYLDKYHLQKVEPVKNRSRNTPADFINFKQKVEKGNVVKIPIKPRPPVHNHYFHNEELRTQYRNPKTEQIIRHHHDYDDHFGIKIDQKRQGQFSSEKMSHRSHQSLNFKSVKDTSAGTRIMSTLQGFFNKLMRSNEGCTCGDPCPTSVKLFQWADIPLQIVKEHYFKSQHKLAELMKSNQNQSSRCSIQNSLSQQTIKMSNQLEQLRKNEIQIRKDLNRTQSESSTFQNEVFRNKMYNILMCYGLEDVRVGYIQGMNMILSGIIFHIKDQIRAYAVFRKLIYSIRPIYINGFKECYEHIAKIKSYVNTHIHDLYEMFEELVVDLNVVCLPWVLSLLTSLVPLQYLHHIYLGFTEDGWPFIYRVCLAIMIYHKEKMIDLYDPGEILSLFSPTNEKKGDYDWQDIIEYSNCIVL